MQTTRLMEASSFSTFGSTKRGIPDQILTSPTRMLDEYSRGHSGLEDDEFAKAKAAAEEAQAILARQLQEQQQSLGGLVAGLFQRTAWTPVSTGSHDGSQELTDKSLESLDYNGQSWSRTPRTPAEKLKAMVGSFQRNVERAMDRVLQLQKQRSMLLDERFVALAKERLAFQQMAQAESDRVAATKAEDYELVEELALAIDGHSRDKSELKTILESITSALAEVESQKQDVVGGVVKCFEDLKWQLKTFEREQEAVGLKDPESMKEFSSTARQLSTEDERIQNALKLLERDEGWVVDERKDLERSISEQASDLENKRDQAKGEMEGLEDEIEELQRQLKEKQAKVAWLRTELVNYDSNISNVRGAFARELTRVEKLETWVKDNRVEWEKENSAYEAQKTLHDAEVKKYSDAFSSHNEILSTIKKEINLAGTFETIVANEVIIESTGDQGEVADGELAQLHADVVTCEAAVAAAKNALESAEALIAKLEAEHKALIEHMPVLEEEKKAAIAHRDFKTAGKLSNDIKDAVLQLKECQEELNGEAVEQLNAALAELEVREAELVTSQTIADEKEKDIALETMSKLGEKIKRLVLMKKKVCGAAVAGTVQGAGAFVLKGQINSLIAEGQRFGAKFGGWDDIMDKVEEAYLAAVIEDDDEDIGEFVYKIDKPAVAKAFVSAKQTKREPSDVDPDRIAKFKEVKVRFNQAEAALEAAVGREDYDDAEVLDFEFQEVKNELEALGLTDAEKAIAMEEDEAESGSEDAVDIDENSESSDEAE